MIGVIDLTRTENEAIISFISTHKQQGTGVRMQAAICGILRDEIDS